VKPDSVELIRRDYTANAGWETFLSYEDPRQDILIGLLRLRAISGPDEGRQPELRGRWGGGGRSTGMLLLLLGVVGGCLAVRGGGGADTVGAGCWCGCRPGRCSWVGMAMLLWGLHLLFWIAATFGIRLASPPTHT
jgi:hypothetical protein